MNGLNSELVDIMRSKRAAGESLSSILQVLQVTLGKDIVTMHTIVTYFRRAFLLPISDIVKIEASELLGGKAYTAQQIENLLLPAMRSFVANQTNGMAETPD